MTEKTNHWFRLDIDFATDPRIQTLHETFQRRFIMFHCLNVRFPLSNYTSEELSFALRISEEELHLTIEKLQEKGLLDTDLNILDWDKKLLNSITSTDRVRRFRAKQKDETDETFHSVSHETDGTPLHNSTVHNNTIKKTKAKKENLDFEKFWLMYPKRVNKKSALDQWERHVSKDPDLPDKIFTALDSQIRERELQTQHGFRLVVEFQDPERWIKNHRWGDEVMTEEQIRVKALQEKPKQFGNAPLDPAGLEQQRLTHEKRLIEQRAFDAETKRKTDEALKNSEEKYERWKREYPDINFSKQKHFWVPECLKRDEEKIGEK